MKGNFCVLENCSVSVLLVVIGMYFNIFVLYFIFYLDLLCEFVYFFVGFQLVMDYVGEDFVEMYGKDGFIFGSCF